MKILHIGNVSSETNGITQVLLNLSKAQIKVGQDVHTLTVIHKKEPLPSFIEVQNLSNFRKIVESFKPDICVFHSLYKKEYIRFYSFLHGIRIPYFIQLHGALSRDNYKKSYIKKRIANLLLYNRFIKKANAIIYLNKAEYDNSIVKDINPNAIIIPNGCPKSELSNVNKNKDFNKINILYLGRIKIHHKGLDKLIKAVQILYKDGLQDKVHFSFYGNGHENEIDVFKESIHGFEGFADFYGTAYGEAKIRAFKDSDIFILTSRYEGMPMGILEALSYGLPCIITKETNMADVIDEYDCGWITEIEPEKIASTIKKMLEEYPANWKKYNQNAIDASKEFSWDRIAIESIEKYKRFI